MSKKHKHAPKEPVTTERKVYGDSNNKASSWGADQKQEEKVECSLIKEIVVLFDLTVRTKVTMLMKEYQHREWLGYLIGENVEGGDVLCTDLVIPPHEESNAGSATAEPFNVPANCVGVIHSHHGMRAFHSGIDDTHVDRNFPVSITVARDTQDKLEYDAKASMTTLCGKWMLGKAKVSYLTPEPDFDTKAWLEAAKENVDKGLPVTKVYGRDVHIPGQGQVGHPGIMHPNVPGEKEHGHHGAAWDRQKLTQESVKEDLKKQWGNRKDEPLPVVVTKKMQNALSARVFDQCNGLVLTRAQLTAILEKNPTAHIDGDFGYDKFQEVWSP